MPASTKEIAVFGSSATRPGSAEWEDAVRCGRLIAEAGLAVVTGGYGGVMEAASLGAAGAGGHVVGVISASVFPSRLGPNPHIAELVEAASLTQRIHLLLDRASAVIALPGSLGTFAELVAAWNDAYVAPLSGRRPQPIVAVGGTWRKAVEAVAAQLAAPAELIHFVDSVDEAVAAVVRAMRPFGAPP
jgi:uncharacterized protein (TIGR00730 family)